MRNKVLERKIGLIAGAGMLMAAAPQLHAASNPFELGASGGTAIMVAEAGKEKSVSVLEGKCGSGKCGTQRVRQVMDKNGDSKIDRDEYVSWSSAAANREFDSISKGSAAVGADTVFEHYQSLEFHNQG
jgi:uncharacterized low-complexity protein